MARLSELGRRVLNAASQIARSYEQKSLFPEHILLALTQERRSVAKNMLIESQCNIEQLQQIVPRLPRHSIEAQTVIDQILDRAVDRAEAMGSHYTGTEHILLAMTMNPRSQHMLAEYGIDVGQLQVLLHQALSE
jgi:ATP-dependent Clp protease ATP-binding subunit ClpA